jgi:hypothetical protein
MHTCGEFRIDAFQSSFLTPCILACHLSKRTQSTKTGMNETQEEATLSISGYSPRKCDEPPNWTLFLQLILTHKAAMSLSHIDVDRQSKVIQLRQLVILRIDEIVAKLHEVENDLLQKVFCGDDLSVMGHPFTTSKLQLLKTIQQVRVTSAGLPSLLTCTLCTGT